MENKRGFGSRLGFFISMAAFSIGIGNLWKFPYVVGNNGGGAFLIIYLVLVLLIGIPALMIEFTLGRSSGLSPIRGMKVLTGGKRSPWQSIGWAGSIAIFIIVSYACMIVGGWTLGYVVKIATGAMQGLTADEIGGVFGSFCGDYIIIAGMAVESVLLFASLAGGVKKGVEKVNKIILPLLFAIMIFLIIYANTLDGAVEGLKWYLIPDWSGVSAASVSAAATQVFFSIGVGMCCAFVYGSYIDKDSDIVKSSVLIGVADTLIAVMSGLIIVPALFAYGIEPAAGPSLIYITLPNLFNQMGSFGTAFGVLFMICVFFAGFTSILGGSEALVACLEDTGKVKRKAASAIVVLAQLAFGIIFTMSFHGGNPLSAFTALGMGFFDFFDFISSSLLCIGALLMVLFVIFSWRYSRFMEEVNRGATGALKITKSLKAYFCVVFPVLLCIVIYCIISGYLL